MQLNYAMCPRTASDTRKITSWNLESGIVLSNPVRRLQELLQAIEAIVEEAPPDTGPRRFGNISFRKWHEMLESRTQDLLKTYLPSNVLSFVSRSEDEVSALDELTSYFLGGFGSPQRLDYGTGHELSFLAFLGCIWKLGGFTMDYSGTLGDLERSLVLDVVEPYVLLSNS